MCVCIYIYINIYIYIKLNHCGIAVIIVIHHIVIQLYFNKIFFNKLNDVGKKNYS